MMFEGTAKYFWLIALIFLVVFITVKICQAYIFKTASIPSWKAYIPFYNRLLLIDKLDFKRSVFFMTLIPFVNLYYYYIIIQKLLEAYNMDSKDAIFFVLIPMYKFPELVFQKPQFMLHMYDNTEAFIQNEKSLFEEEKPAELVISPENYPTPQMMGNENVYTTDTVFSNSSLEPDERKETIIEAKTENVVKTETNPISVQNNQNKVCPRCGTQLGPTSTTCFFCGETIS